MFNITPLSAAAGENATQEAQLQKAKDLASHMGKNAKKNEELMEACKEFESLFVNTMLKSMREAVPKYDMLKSPAEEVFQSMLDQEISKSSVKDKGMGIAEMLFKEFSKNGPKIE